jgi:multiple sugar transport system substrate-binding protein
MNWTGCTRSRASAFPGQNTLKIIDVIKDNLQAIVSKQATPEAALKRAGDEVRKLSKGS